MFMESRQAIHQCSKCSFASANAFCGRCCDLLNRIEREGSKSTCRRKTNFFLQGQRPRGVFILCTGTAKLLPCSNAGKTIITRISQPGDLLGLNAVVSDRVYSVTAEMMETGQVTLIPRHALLRMMREHEQMAVAVAEELSRSYYPVHEVLRDSRSWQATCRTISQATFILHGRCDLRFA